MNNVENPKEEKLFTRNSTYEGFDPGRDSLDGKDFGPYWLEGIQGSLAEERRRSSSKKILLYNRQVRKARRKSSKCPLNALDFLSNPNILDIKLSELWALYPTLEISFDLSVQRITKSNSKLLRGFVLFYFLEAKRLLPKYMQYDIEEQFDAILFGEKKFPMSEKIRKEILVIRKIFSVVEPQMAENIVKCYYSEYNLSIWIETQKNLWKNYQMVYIPYAKVRSKVLRRGYRESHSNKHKTRDRRGEVKMSTEGRTLEEIKQSILRKQAVLFERRLDAYLALESPDLPPDKRREIFNSLVEPEKVDEAVLQEEINAKLWENPSQK